MARKRQTPDKEDDRRPRRSSRVIPDSDSEEESLPPRGVSNGTRSTNDVPTSDPLDQRRDSNDEDDGDVPLPRMRRSARNLDALEADENDARSTADARTLHSLNQSENSDNQGDEDVFLPRRRRTAKKTDGPQADEHVIVEVPQRQASTPMQSNLLRRSSRGAALKGGPRAYSNRWHPIDDLKASKTIKKKTSQGKIKNPDSKSAKESTSVTREKGNEREGNLQRDSEDIHERSADEDKPSSHTSRRRSSRNVYNADVAMKYDMSSHWSPRKLLQPKAFAKKLEQKRRSIAQDLPKHKDSDVQSISTPSLSPQKPLKHQKYKPDDFRTKADVNEEIRSIDSSRATPSPSRRDKDEHNLPPSPGALPVSDLHPDNLPMVLDDEMVLHEQDPNLPPYSDVVEIPKGNDLYMQILHPLPDKKSPEIGVKPLDWTDLTNFDRRLYTLQRGAPANGGTLPLQWAAVQQTLIEEGYRKTLGSMSDDVNISYLRARYEYIRLGVEAFFKAKPEPEGKRDWTLFRIEDFDVFDCRKGRKYRKRSEDNVVKPVETVAEHSLPNPQPCISISDQEVPSRPLDDVFIAKTQVVANDIRTQVASALDTQQIDNLLALADPCEEIDSLLPLTSPQQIHVSTTNRLQDLEYPADRIDDDHAAHELSEKSLMEVMQTTQPASFNGTSAEKQADVEAFLAGIPWSQELCPDPPPRPSEQVEKTRSSIKRRKRNTATDFFSIHEDDTADQDVTRIEVQDRQCGQKRELHLDLPVENMTAGELVPGSQERRAVSPPRRLRFRTDGISHGHPLQTSIWVDGEVQTSIFGGSHPWVVSGFSAEG